VRAAKTNALLPQRIESALTQLAEKIGDPSQGGAPWLSSLRAGALDSFRAAGFPTRDDEQWRFTSLEPVERATYALAPGAKADEAAARAVVETTLGLEPGPRLVFLNGRLCASLSSIDGLPPGARLAGMRDILGRDGAVLQKHLGRPAAAGRSPFTALNSGLWEDGAVLHLDARTIVAEPISIVFLTSSDAAALTSPRVLIVAEEGAQATILECYGPLGADRHASLAAYFTNAVTEVVVEAGAVVDHVKLQLESPAALHLATTAARIARDGRYMSRSVSAGGALVRNDLVTVLDGEGAECTLDGLFLATGTQHIDNHTTIDHAKPHGTSRETYKGILGGRARGVFDGRIIVRADAQKTDSRQVNRNLLLSDAALINTKPQLEINADDVKCAHAATIGRLDEAALFYLRSRGMGHEQARALLIEAFAGEVVGRIAQAPLRNGIERLVHAVAVSGSKARIGEAA